MKAITHWIDKIRPRLKKILGKSPHGDRHLGQILVDKGIITQEQLDIALDTQKERLMETGQAVRLGHIVNELGFADEEKIVGAINEGFLLSVSSLSDNIRELILKNRGTLSQRLPAPRIPIWLKLSIGALVIVAITVFTFSFMTINKQKEQLFQQTVRVGTVSLNYFVNNARIPLLDEDILRLNTLIKEATATEGMRYAFITDTKDIIRAHTEVDLIGSPHFGIAPSLMSRKKGDVTYFTSRSAAGENILNMTRDVFFQKKMVGHVYVGVSLDFIETLVAREKRSILLTTITIAAIGLAIAVILGIRFSRPISSLVAATEEIGRGNYKHRVTLKRNDELGNLARAFNQMGEDLFRHSLTRESFGKYVGGDVLEMILADPESMWLKGHRNQATILFADIRGFTAYSDDKEPEAIVEMLNQFFGIATESILSFGGFIDKFIGDAVLGVFGVPVYRKDHVERAVRAALELSNRLRNSGINDNHLLASVGIGIHTGVVVSGNIGSQAKMEYTVIGSTVNIASRVSGLAAPGEILVTDAVYSEISSMATAEKSGPHIIKGRNEPLDTYRVVDIRERSHVKAET